MFDPIPGTVIRYDFLWREQQAAGIEQGVKDRPCAIVLATKPQKDGSKLVLLAPITHSPILKNESGVEVPLKVALSR